MAVDLTMGMLLAALDAYRWYRRLRICTHIQCFVAAVGVGACLGPPGVMCCWVPADSRANAK